MNAIWVTDACDERHIRAQTLNGASAANIAIHMPVINAW